MCVCVSTAPGAGQIQRTHFTAVYTLYNCVCDKKKKGLFFTKPISDYGKMLKYGKNISNPIYRSISITQNRATLITNAG